MKLQETEKSYRRMAIESASPIGLILVLFDLLASDLRRAASALRANDIETRCKELNHAALVLGQLQSWVDLERGGESAKILLLFYSHLRKKMMEAAVTKSAEVLEKEIESIVHIRNSWQKFEPFVNQTLPNETLLSESSSPPPALPDTLVERTPLSLSV
jgi:flagellar secretion chaperone FliS